MARNIPHELARLANEVKAIKKGQRYAHGGSIEDAALEVRDGTGTVRAVIGVQPDGTVGLVAHDGPPPGAPTAPTVTPSIGGLRVVWDGALADGSPLPADFDHVAVHASTESGFVPSAATFVGTITRAGDGGMLPLVPLPYQPHYVALAAVNTSGNSGAPSAQTEATPIRVDGPDLKAGSVTAAAIEAGAVTADKLEAVLQLVTRLVAGDPAGARVELNEDGLRVYNSTGQLVIRFDSADGSAVFSGVITGSTVTGSTLQTSPSGQRVVVTPSNAFGLPSVQLYSGQAAETAPGEVVARVRGTTRPRPYVAMWAPTITKSTDTSAYLQLFSGGGTNNDQGEFELSTGTGSGGITSIYAYASDGAANGGEIVHSLYEPVPDAYSTVTHTRDMWEYADTSGRAFGLFQGVFFAPNMAYGRVTITPTAANTPTSATVTYARLPGTNFEGYACASTAVPGVTVTGVSMNGVGATSATVWCTRSNLTATGVSWQVIGRNL